MAELDPRLTFGSFVVGPSNQLASAAARRAAESPGTSYNPLFLYSAPGLGKTHILTAIAHKSDEDEASRKVEYMALEEYLDRLERSLQAGQSDGLRYLYGDLDILLVDDVQFLTDQPEAQEMLLKTLERLTAAGGQIVLASDRPPADINGLNARLLSRFSGGLIVDLGAPEYETPRGNHSQEGGGARAEASRRASRRPWPRRPSRTCARLGGVLNKIFAMQDLEDRRVSLDDVGALMAEQDKAASLAGGSEEFDDFLDDLASSVADAVEDREEPWQKAIRETIDSAERQGVSALRLEALQDGSEPEAWEKIVEDFKADIQRLNEIDNELERLGNPWPEAAQGILEDPGRLEEAEALLTSVRERQRPFPKLGEGSQLHDLDGFENIAMKAAAQLVGEERPEYNPLYVWSSDEGIGRTLLAAVGRTYREAHPDSRMAVGSVEVFANDFIRALGDGVAGAWRERWWTVDLLLVHRIQELSETERAQDEFFHLFEALKRRGARIMLAADRPPSAIDSIDDHLRSRFEGGLVLELSSGSASDLELLEVEEAQDDSIFVPALEGDSVGSGGDSGQAEPVPIAVAEPPQKGGAWFPGPENMVIYWPKLDELLMEELD